MAKAKKRGDRWRVLVYDRTDEAGKRLYKSFTADTKAEAEYLAAQFAAGRAEQVADLTVNEALNRYVEAKKGVLSPSTMRGYDTHIRCHYEEIGDTAIRDLDNTTLQLWVSNLSRDRSPKTVRNAYGLLTATLAMFRPDYTPRATLPAKKKPDLYVPSDEDVRTLLEQVKGTELELAILLAAFGPLRRGEICALEDTDVHGSTITVSKCMVDGTDKQWYIKQPKTYSSYRDVVFPDFVIEKLPQRPGRIIQCNPTVLSSRFRHAMDRSGLHHFRFHDLRHYSASIMHAIGVPDQYIMARGGWKTDGVMKAVYRGTISTETDRQTERINDHFRDVAKMQR